MLVGQEAVTLSTAPACVDGMLAPRPMSLRVFLARTPRGWRVMPGGYARIGRTQDATAIAMQRGGSVADVWVVSRQAGAQRDAAALARRTLSPRAARASCRAAPPTISSGWAAMSSAPKA